jgi:hypothetical protein
MAAASPTGIISVRVARSERLEFVCFSAFNTFMAIGGINHREVTNVIWIFYFSLFHFVPFFIPFHSIPLHSSLKYILHTY